MKKSLTKLLIGTFTGLLLLSGCTGQETIQYTNLTPDEQNLLAIQDETTAQIGKLNSELQKSGLNYEQVNSLASETSKLITEKVEEVKDLADEIQNSTLISDTQRILESAKRLTDKVNELASNLQTLEQDIARLTDEAQTQMQQKIDETRTMLEGYKSRLANIKDQFVELRASLESANQNN